MPRNKDRSKIIIEPESGGLWIRCNVCAFEGNCCKNEWLESVNDLEFLDLWAKYHWKECGVAHAR